MKFTGLLRKILLVVFMGFMIYSCAVSVNPFEDTTTNTDTVTVPKGYGILSVDIPKQRGWSVAEYDVTATKSGETPVNATTSTNSISMVLKIGTWNIDVSGHDSDGNEIYQGTASATVTETGTSVAVGLLKKAGNLKLNLSNITGYNITSGQPGFIEKIIVTASKTGFADVVQEISDFDSAAIFSRLSQGSWNLSVVAQAKTLNSDYSQVPDSYTTYVTGSFTKTVVANVITEYSEQLTTQTKVTPVIFNYGTGTYSSATTVTLTCATIGATISWTDDNWSTSHTGTSFDINGSSKTIRAKATKSGLIDSMEGVNTYTWDGGATSSPQFSPVGGTYTSDQSVVISCPDSGATIEWTDDNWSTNHSGTAPVTVNVAGNGTTKTIKAKATASGKTVSNVVEQIYSIVYTPVASPVISPLHGGYNTSQLFSIACGTSGATIYYTTDGSDPSNSGNANRIVYSSTFTLSAGTYTIKAYAIKSGYSDSAVVSEGTYTITDEVDNSIVFTQADIIIIGEMWKEDSILEGITWYGIETQSAGTYTIEWSSGFSGVITVYENDLSTEVTLNGTGNSKTMTLSTARYFIKVNSDLNMNPFQIRVMVGGTPTTTTTTTTTSTTSSTSTTTTSTTTTTLPPASLIIHAKNYTHIHYWNTVPDSLSTTWPGEAMTAESGGWYTYTISGQTSASIVFSNNGSGQTGDLSRTTVDEWWYNGSWFDHNPDGPTAPTVSSSPAGGDFTASTIDITLHVTGDSITACRYTTDGSDPSISGTDYTDNTVITIGSGMNVGDSLTLKLYAINSEGNDTATYTFNKTDTSYTERDNTTILQGFYWYIPDPSSEAEDYTAEGTAESDLWEYYADAKAEEVYNDGFSHIWLPPSGKAFSPDTTYNSGYAIYDHYDLGQFDQMGRIRTKYGTKQKLIDAVNAFHTRKIKAIADIVMNHMLGTDNSETIDYSMSYDDTGSSLGSGSITAYLNFDFLNSADNGRGTQYSNFVWTSNMFDGMENYSKYYLFNGRTLDTVDNFGDMSGPSDYQYLRSDIILGADLDLQNTVVQDEMINWTKWLVNTVGFDGFRVDAIRHMHTPFVERWANEISTYMTSIGKGGDKMLMFGENWDGWAERLNAYLTSSSTGTNTDYANNGASNYCGINNSMSLFDVPLHYDFQKIAGENSETLKIGRLGASGGYAGTGLIGANYSKAITFVDNHDTVPTQMLASYIPYHTKMQAYTYILLNAYGVPCVYYRDLYKGNYTGDYTNDHYTELHDGIKKLMEVRNNYAYGPGTYYNYGETEILGYKRDGDALHSGSGCIYLIRQNGSSANGVTIPTDGKTWVLYAGSGHESGGTFYLDSGDWAVWVPQS